MPKPNCNNNTITAIEIAVVALDLITVNNQRNTSQETNKAAINKIKLMGILFTKK
ncbi:hypothetical protein AsFPU3_0368 [Aphanothece sacrum FPU3]|nr:hypothetical protein AsFPU3_0368 [Aphanothece sacrum FPU3]